MERSKMSTGSPSEIKEAAEMEQAFTKRGWRFYGTISCLALVNFICAIDATILSVALPVRDFLHSLSKYLTVC